MTQKTADEIKIFISEYKHCNNTKEHMTDQRRK